MMSNIILIKKFAWLPQASFFILYFIFSLPHLKYNFKMKRKTPLKDYQTNEYIFLAEYHH